MSSRNGDDDDDGGSDSSSSQDERDDEEQSSEDEDDDDDNSLPSSYEDDDDDDDDEERTVHDVLVGTEGIRALRSQLEQLGIEQGLAETIWGSEAREFCLELFADGSTSEDRQIFHRMFDELCVLLSLLVQDQKCARIETTFIFEDTKIFSFKGERKGYDEDDISLFQFEFEFTCTDITYGESQGALPLGRLWKVFGDMHHIEIRNPWLSVGVPTDLKSQTKAIQISNLDPSPNLLSPFLANAFPELEELKVCDYQAFDDDNFEHDNNRFLTALQTLPKLSNVTILAFLSRWIIPVSTATIIGTLPVRDMRLSGIEFTEQAFHAMLGQMINVGSVVCLQLGIKMVSDSLFQLCENLPKFRALTTLSIYIDGGSFSDYFPDKLYEALLNGVKKNCFLKQIHIPLLRRQIDSDVILCHRLMLNKAGATRAVQELPSITQPSLVPRILERVDGVYHLEAIYFLLKEHAGLQSIVTGSLPASRLSKKLKGPISRN